MRVRYNAYACVRYNGFSSGSPLDVTRRAAEIRRAAPPEPVSAQ